jgi:hypothetical protein
MTVSSRLAGVMRGFWVIALVLVVFAMLKTSAKAQSGKDMIALTLDQAQLVRLPDRAATIVVGNPLIADASIQPGGLMVLTGKGYGMTNLIALDDKGDMLMEKQLLVQSPDQEGVVVVYKGVHRQTYSCSPLCDPRNTLGDSPQFFGQTLSEITTRNSQSLGMGSK